MGYNLEELVGLDERKASVDGMIKGENNYLTRKFSEVVVDDYWEKKLEPLLDRWKKKHWEEW